MEREEYWTIVNLLMYLSLGCIIVDSYRVTRQLSCGEELRNGFLGRPRWVKPTTYGNVPQHR